MSTEVTTYQLTRKNGRVDKVTFTGKRGEILELVKAGKSNDEIVAAGFNKGTTSIVRWQAKRLGLYSATGTTTQANAVPAAGANTAAPSL